VRVQEEKDRGAGRRGLKLSVESICLIRLFLPAPSYLLLPPPYTT